MQGKKKSKGFTLVELMIVMVILGILAAIALIGWRRYVQRSKVSEVYTMLGDIRAKQEAYRAEFSQYCNVSGSLTEGNRWPRTAPCPDGRKVDWDTGVPAGWQQLGVRPDGAVWMGYVTTAGFPGQAISGESPPPVNTNDHWWAARAYGDLDGDTTFSTYDAISGARGVIITNEGE